MDQTLSAGVESVHISARITEETALEVRPVSGYPGNFIIQLGFLMPTIHIHATNEQLTRLRDVLSEHLAGGAGGSDA
jgi:hypothetical protein